MPVYPGAPPHFCPPRLEVVVKEQNPNGFSSHPRDQSPFDSFLYHQTDGPAGAAFGRIAAHHSDDPLFLRIVEYGCCAGALLFEQRRFQTALLVTTRNRTDALRSERNDLRDPGCAGAFGQLQQHQGAQNDSNLLNTATQQFGECLLISWRDFDLQRWTTHTPSMRQNNST